MAALRLHECSSWRPEAFMDDRGAKPFATLVFTRSSSNGKIVLEVARNLRNI